MYGAAVTPPTAKQIANGIALMNSTSRSSLRKVLEHAMFTPARRQKAEELMKEADAATLLRWKLKAMEEIKKYEGAS
ncbi:hypothetical protein [Hymenobacter defluvii]|uniref:Uncharacterized protein n=1 Tax=Hymenobacter defluvii TaxID=2054411 RepID=A0ABS3THG3_9BACT|nr:hypothetical protein [Hymenobacter defluvii]MBO3273078.1 hypothetical protein [Hymenobacter defluvii]